MNFINYGRQTIDTDDINSVVEVLKSDFLTTGPFVSQFEEEIAKYCGAKYCVVVSNGTAALHLSSLALLQENDKVLTTPNSFVATSNSILYAKAKPVFVDICEDGNINLDLCEEKLKLDSSIKAIYAVSFSGNMVNQIKLKYLKDKYNIKILEDNAHAIGAKYKCKIDNEELKIQAGSCVNSDISIFSFHPVKHITTAEGGAITTNNQALYEKIKLLRNHGIVKDNSMKPWEYEIDQLGFNYRLSDLQSALGISQLKKLDTFIEKRHQIAQYYDKALQNMQYIKPLYKFHTGSSYHLYVVRVDFTKLQITKEQLFLELKKKNIGVQLHYIPINKQPYYKSLGYGDEITPMMDKYYQEVLSLPIFPTLSNDEQNYVINELKSILKTTFLT